MQLVFDFPISPRYSFRNFVVCDGNRAAWQFARLLLQDESQRVLYVYGPAGAGKTHLLHAIGSEFCDKLEQGSSLPYISLKDLDALYCGDYRPEQASKLGERFADAPVLLIDDIHLMPPVQSLRVEFWQVFNDFHALGKKIIITGGNAPRELQTLDDHLISRLLWGLVAEMDISDDSSRRLIIKKLAGDRNVMIPEEVIDHILSHVNRDIPSLKEALDSINRYALSTGRKITMKLAREALASSGGSRQ